ncbi:MAG: mechanosensitive ion channel family protein [Clostridia bacterium]|nr:mechanosensitive ion channel family protein [Clostridia bacterium]
MEQFKEFFSNLMHMQFISSIVVVVISIILYECIAHFLRKREKSSNLRMFKSKKGKTYYKLIISVIRYIFIIVTVLILLQVNGVNVSSMLAGVGIMGVIIGFAIQDALKDFVKGFDIISDSYYNVGDVIKFKDIEGKVLSIGLKTTKIEDIRTLNVISVSNRNIEQVEVVSNILNISIPMPYEVEVKKAEKVVKSISENIAEDELINSCEYKGVTDLAESSINYLIQAKCNSENKLQARRNILRCILVGLEKNNIHVPYNQIDVHQK